MKFKNKETGEIVKAKEYAEIFAYSHNSNWEQVKENERPNRDKNKEEKTPEDKEPEKGDE